MLLRTFRLTEHRLLSYQRSVSAWTSSVCTVFGWTPARVGTTTRRARLFNGNIFPTDSDGRAVDEFGSLGLTAKAKFSNTELKYGTLVPMLPVVMSTGRMLQQTFNGGQIQSKDLENFTFTLGQLEHVKGRGSSNQIGMSIPGANNPQSGEFVNKFYYGGVDYKPTKDLTLQYYYGNLQDFYK